MGEFEDYEAGLIKCETDGEGRQEISADAPGISLKYRNYRGYKQEMDQAVFRAAEQFVVIGYLLKVARDTDVLRESGYKSVLDFARAEYGIDRGTASKFMSINDRFSKEGYSPVLAEQYRGFRQSVLADMLALPEVVNAELSKDFSREDVRTLKEEVKAEATVSDLEVLMEERDARQESLDSTGKIVYQMGKDFPALYAEIFEVTRYDQIPELSDFKEILAPDEEKIWTVRIPGAGKVLVSVKTAEAEVAFIYVRTGERETCTWEQFLYAWKTLMHPMALGVKASWEAEYGERFPEVLEEKKKVPEAESDGRKAKAPEKKVPKVETPKKKAPEQKMPEAEKKAPETEQKMPEPDSKKTEIAPAQKYTAQEAEASGAEGRREPGIQMGAGEPAAEPATESLPLEEEQIPGQDNIEAHPEWMPEPQAVRHKSHSLRLCEPYFTDIAEGRKTFELRKNDRDFQVGDRLEMRLFRDGVLYSGRMVQANIVYKLDDYPGLEAGYCILGIRI